MFVEAKPIQCHVVDDLTKSIKELTWIFIEKLSDFNPLPVKRCLPDSAYQVSWNLVTPRLNGACFLNTSMAMSVLIRVKVCWGNFTKLC